MKNFIQPGNNIDVQAPADVLSGEAVVIGNLFGYAIGDALSGADLSMVVEGVVNVPKLVTNVMAVGAKVNYNTATGELQLATSTLDDVGTVIVAAGNGDALVKVKLTPL